jgi:outer membrane protein TolC
MRHTSSFRTAFVAVIAALAIGGASGEPALAQTPAVAAPEGPPGASGAVSLTLPDAIERALRASHRIGEFQARREAATAQAAARSAADMPTISLLGGYMRTNHVDEYAIPGGVLKPPTVIYPDVPDNWRTRLDLQWPIYTFGRVQALERSARSEVMAAEKDVTTSSADSRLDATRAFWALVTANESVRVVEEALALVDAHLRDVKNMQDAGLLAPNDVLMVEARRSRQQVQLIEARNMRDVAEADLRRVTGLAPDIAITTDAVLEEPPPALPAHGTLLAEARAGRSERQALLARMDAIGERRTAVAAGLKPTIAVAAGFDYARPNPRIFPRAGEWNDSWDVGVNVAWPLWDGGRVKADVAEVAANRRAVEQRLAEFDTVLDFEVKQRQLDLGAARASILAATDELAAAAEARRVVSERFRAGLVTNTEVLDAQQALLVAQFDRTRALASARLAQARLDRALGR